MISYGLYLATIIIPRWMLTAKRRKNLSYETCFKTSFIIVICPTRTRYVSVRPIIITRVAINFKEVVVFIIHDSASSEIKVF